MEDELMLRRAQQGDTVAFERLIGPHETMLWRVCWQLMGNTEDAKDALQETMLKAWRSLKSYRGEAALSTWLYRVAVSCCTDAQRRQRLRHAESVEAMHEAGYDPPSAAPGPEAEALQRDRRRQLRQALSQLPEEQRTVLVLTAVEGKSYEETAALLGVAVGTVKSRCNRARNRLSALLSSDETQTDDQRSNRNRRREQA